MKIRTGDKVIVLSGKEQDRNKTSEVLKVFLNTHKVLIKDVNIVTRHMKKQGTTPGQIIKMEKPIDASNVLLVCPYTNKPTRIGFVMLEEKGKSKKMRFSKKALAEKGGKPSDFIIK